MNNVLARNIVSNSCIFVKRPVFLLFLRLCRILGSLIYSNLVLPLVFLIDGFKFSSSSLRHKFSSSFWACNSIINEYWRRKERFISVFLLQFNANIRLFIIKKDAIIHQPKQNKHKNIFHSAVTIHLKCDFRLKKWIIH
jgi:hypothetical protein